MGSSSNMDLENLSLLLAQDKPLKGFKNLDIEPTPYTFTKVENGKKMVMDSPSLTPPSWLLLDHTIAVVWLLFSSQIPAHQLNINDLKWAHEFLKEIKNSKGENPPDVKTCLREIQDRLIHLYARLTNLKDEFERDNFFENSRTRSPRRVTSKLMDRMSQSSSLSPSRTTVKLEYPLLHGHSSRDLTVPVPKQKKIGINYLKKSPLASKNGNITEDIETLDDEEEVEKFFISLLEGDKDDDLLQPRQSTKSFIPRKKGMTPAMSISEVMSSRDFSGTLKDSAPKRVHCVAEMRSVKYQKSMKLDETNGEEMAFAALKAEIQRLTINPNVSKDELRKFLKEWRTEQVDKLRSDLNRLNSIEEIIKTVEGVHSKQENSSFLGNIKLHTSKSNSALVKKLEEP